MNVTADEYGGNPAAPGPSLGPVDLREFRVLLQSRGAIKNWLELGVRAKISKLLSKGWMEASVELRDGSPPLSIASASEASLAFYTGYLSAKWGFDPVSTIRHLLGIASDLNLKMRNEYRLPEITSGKVGGWTGAKEVALYLITRAARPVSVIETGVAQGFSSTFILDALRQNGGGHLTSIDLPSRNHSGSTEAPVSERPNDVYVKAGLETGWLVPEGLRDRWRLILGDSGIVLPQLSGHVDLFFHDSLHTYSHMMFEYEWALSHMHVDSILVSDDVNRNSAFLDFVHGNRDRLRVLSTETVGIAMCVR